MTGMDHHLSLFITSGNGPAECHQAVAGVLNAMRDEAEGMGLGIDTSVSPARHGLRSAVVLISGPQAEAFAMRWRGTIQWRAKSNLRPQHKRANWFVGVFDLPRSHQSVQPIHQRDVTFESFRAGGPGGQHQNTTDSAVRAVHRPTGLTAVAREDRSQHRNKSRALERLKQLMAARAVADEQAQKASQNQMNHALERGNPVRVFTGHTFREKRSS